MKLPVKRHEVQQPLDKPYRYIPLTQHQVAIVDAKDFQWLNQWNWAAVWSPSTKSFYAHRAFRKGIRLMHRLILGCKKHEETDHWNHDTLDNRRENLVAFLILTHRWASASQAKILAVRPS